jgi:chloramphenicol-sensitive protein RarD
MNADPQRTAPGGVQLAGARRSRAGVLYAGGAFFVWGLIPIYFRALGRVAPHEIIAHRVLWSALLLTLVQGLGHGYGTIRALLGRPRAVAGLVLTSALLTSNWLTFVWAVNAGRVLETSLGYFLTPTVNVLLGVLFLGERLRRTQWLAVALAAAGVVNQIVILGHLPWISLVLAVTFGGYGLFRKRIDVDPATGLFVETVLAAPLALGYLIYLAHTGSLAFSHRSALLDGLLVLLGPITAVPLMMFAAGARRLRLATVGFLQYLAPSLTFLLAVFVFGEPLGLARALTFALIWAGIALYAFEGVHRARRTEP